MKLSIIIVNWKSSDFLRKCLLSVLTSSKDISVEVIVIDNASFDGSEKMVSTEFPGVRFVQSQSNLGFAKGNNLAFEYATGDVLLFLNPDTEIVGAALGCMLDALASIPDAGIVGPMLLNSDLTVQTSCIQSFPSILNLIVDSNYLRKKFPKWSIWGNRALFDDNNRPIQVEGISGACLMIRRATFEKVGRFTPAYFMYGEDMDLCCKVVNLGLKNYYVDNAMVVHHGGQSAVARSEKQFSSIMMRESLLRFMQVHRGGLYAWTFRVTMVPVALCRMSLVAVALVIPKSFLDRPNLPNAFLKWFHVLRWAIGLEAWTKSTGEDLLRSQK